MTPIIRTIAELNAQVAIWKSHGESIGIVPTMGALHIGHISLAARAKAENNRVIATIFVNPTQFNNPEDLAKYPRDEAADVAMLHECGVDVVFAPEPAEMYPATHGTKIDVGSVSEPLEGIMRPGHFTGVATIVAKLFNMTRADRGYFGEKDWQQLSVIQQMVADLNMPVQVIGCPTFRETDGLAMSSRNRRLSAEARKIAPILHQEMQNAAHAIQTGTPPEAALSVAVKRIEQAGFSPVEYLSLCDAVRLTPNPSADTPRRIFAAAWLDGVRLIDNIAV